MKKLLWKRFLCGLSAVSLLTVPLANSISAAASGLKNFSPKTVANISVKKSDSPYYYSAYGYGSLFTYRYTVSFNDMKATAYCVQPMKTPPDSGIDFKIQKLSDGKKLAKVCYYGTRSSQENGFFSQPEYADFTEGQKYILVHMAASYANGDPDAFSGASEKGRALALKLYEYCISQPDIPDVAMSFSKDTLDAYADGDRQRTPSITFRADTPQTITMKLPSGVRLHNETSGKTSAAGETVTLSGGTRFYLTAPLTQAEQTSASWSATMKGSITKDFSAYKVTTTNGNKQDLAFVFGEGVTDEKYVSLKVNWLRTARLNLSKTDASTHHPLAGATYRVFLDKSCTIPIATMPETDADGNTSVSFIRTQDTVYLKEVSAPEGYLPDERIHTVALSKDKTESSLSVSDEERLGKIILSKEDRELGRYESQGDADIHGAVYGVYAAEDIIHPDGKTGILFSKDSLVAKQTISDSSGTTEFDQLHLGKYYVQEIQAPPGYTKDTKKYPVTLSYNGQKEKVIVKKVSSVEDVIRQSFELIKISSNGSNEEAPAVSGAVFTVKLLSEVKKQGWEKAKTYDTLTTDQKGYAKSCELPFGIYQVRETIVPAGLSPVKPFTVTISEDSRTPQTWRIFNDSSFQAYLKLIKKDAKTGAVIQLSGTSFRIRDTESGKFISQKVGDKKLSIFTTDGTGTITTPLKLPMGNYEVTEIQAPYGYVLDSASIPFQVTSDGAIQIETDADGDPVIPLILENHSVTGSLALHKQGEQLNAITKHHFSYLAQPLENVSFELYAAENIYTPDHQTDADGKRILDTFNNIPLVADTLLATLTTDQLGNASISNLPLGKYYLCETTSVGGFVSNRQQIYPFELSYEGENVSVVQHQETITNQRVKTAISIHKSCTKTNKPIANAEFTLYNTQNLFRTSTATSQTVLLPADTPIESVCTDTDGNANFTTDLPPGNYYICETKTPDGYLPDYSRHAVNLTTANSENISDQTQDSQPVFSVAAAHLELKNKPTTTKISKKDISGKQELTGARLSVIDSNGTVMESWISNGTPHIIYALPAGTYTLRENRAPLGYLNSEDILFSVDTSGKTVHITMKDDTPKGILYLTKTDRETKQPLSGVSFELRDEKGVLIQTLITDHNGKAHSDPLKIAEYENGSYAQQKVYTLTETQAADQYQLDKTVHKIQFQYQDGNTPVIRQTLSLTNRKKLTKTHLVKTSDISRRGFLLLFSGAAIAFTCISIFSKHSPNASSKANKRK